jgi:hypothetical protein
MDVKVRRGGDGNHKFFILKTLYIKAEVIVHAEISAEEADEAYRKGLHGGRAEELHRPQRV